MNDIYVVLNRVITFHFPKSTKIIPENRIIQSIRWIRNQIFNFDRSINQLINQFERSTPNFSTRLTRVGTKKSLPEVFYRLGSGSDNRCNNIHSSHHLHLLRPTDIFDPIMRNCRFAHRPISIIVLSIPIEARLLVRCRIGHCHCVTSSHRCDVILLVCDVILPACNVIILVCDVILLL